MVSSVSWCPFSLPQCALVTAYGWSPSANQDLECFLSVGTLGLPASMEEDSGFDFVFPMDLVLPPDYYKAPSFSCPILLPGKQTDFFLHVVSSCGCNPEVSSGLLNLGSGPPGNLLWLAGLQQEPGGGAQQPACDPHMPRGMRSHANLGNSQSKQTVYTVLVMSLLLAFLPPLGSMR